MIDFCSAPRRGWGKAGAFAAVLVLSGIASNHAQAGGYLTLFPGTTPSKWSGNITLNKDLGNLGNQTNAQADTLVDNAVAVWENTAIANCSLNFVTGSDLPSDQTAASNPQYGNGGDGLTPIIYDVDGTLTANKLGAGNENFVLGFAGPVSISGGGVILEGRAVLNGKFIDGSNAGGAEVSVAVFTGVISHEIGHMINLDHSQLNDSWVNRASQDFTGYPTMYPLVHTGTPSLAADDIAWIVDLYPSGSAATLTSIAGTVRNSGGSPINGVNVVARPVGSIRDGISCVSGNQTTGQYEIPSLPANTQYVLDFEQIQSAFVGGSSVGPVDPPLNVPGSPEFINESGFESNSDVLATSTTFSSPASGSLGSVDLRLNGTPSAVLQTETDTGATFTSSAQTLTATPGVPIQVNGTMTVAESGNISFTFNGSVNVKDWYRLTTTGVEAYRIRLVPTTNQVLLVADSAGNIWGISNNSSTTAEQVDAAMATDLAGSIYIGIGSVSGQPNGTYTLTIDSSYSDNAAVAVTGVTGTAPGNLTISGRNFSATGGGPTVTFSDPNLTVNSVTFNNSTTLTVDTGVTGTVTNPVTVTATNAAAANGYGGRLSTTITAIFSSVETWAAYDQPSNK